MFQILKSFWTGLVRLGKSILCSIKRATIFSVQRAAMFFLALCTSASQLFASSTGAGGFTKATTEISSYQTFITCADRNDVDCDKVQAVWQVSASDGEASVEQIQNSEFRIQN